MVPGYVNCPRCHALMPGSTRFRKPVIDPGGTALERRPFPAVPVAIAVVAVAIVLVLVFGGGDKKAEVAPAAAAEPVTDVATNAAPPPPPRQPRALDIPSGPAPAADPRAVTAELERALGRQRLWSNVQASGDRVEVRSASCGEPAMVPMIDAARASLRGAGLTRLRCLAQSGAVVFERDL